MTLLALKNVTKTFRVNQREVQAVRNVSFDVREGECLAIVGESGSGKTTLANMILGLLGATTGEIHFRDAPLPARRPPELRRQIQFVQQNPLSALNAKRTVGSSVRLGLDTYRIGERAARKAAVEAALEAVGLEPELARRPPGALSGGQRQRVGIARALAVEPSLVVLDEPTSALDVLVQARVLRLLNELRAAKKLTYVFITHDLAVVRNIADRCVVLKEGQIVEMGETTALFDDPQHNYTRNLIRAVPVVDQTEVELRNKLGKFND
ncbi:ATP-binding cassette domain-containing protein [Alphaproteobacteria bacterium]|jgi:ABC-type oligopeptide transport system ATPase subunit|nr:ATP-binding cassette domain-containing protein [Alphaproteobacteria bacterium]MDG1415337.1 ATP-binding cassette domain-containing protein [Alphaproteobacteria bacterium]